MSNDKDVQDKIALHGRITIENSNEIRSALAKALREKPQILHVCLSEVSYMDTSAIATLIEAAKISREQGARMMLEGLHDQPRYLLEITHLDHLFDIAGMEVHK